MSRHHYTCGRLRLVCARLIVRSGPHHRVDADKHVVIIRKRPRPLRKQFRSSVARDVGFRDCVFNSSFQNTAHVPNQYKCATQAAAAIATNKDTNCAVRLMCENHLNARTYQRFSGVRACALYPVIRRLSVLFTLGGIGKTDRPMNASTFAAVSVPGDTFQGQSDTRTRFLL